MQTHYVVIGEVHWEGSTLLGAFAGPSAATRHATTRAKAEPYTFDEISVWEATGPTVTLVETITPRRDS